MRLRSFRADDLDTLYEIDQACFPPGISYSRDELARFVLHPKSQTWVAEEGKKILGFVVAGEEPRRVAHIVTLDVDQRARRRGIGSALMTAAEAWAARKKLRLIYLETAAENFTAQQFYLGRGYAKVDDAENYYGRGKDAWVMVKWLE